MIKDILSKYKFDVNSDRIGPDCPFTHWKLYFSKIGFRLCQQKFSCFGNGSSFRPGAYAVSCSKIHIGNNVTIRPNTMLFASPNDEQGMITIEDNVLIGSGVHVYVSNHEFDDVATDIYFQGHRKAKEVIIRKGAWVGANSTILPGVEIGRNAVIGANSVVTKDVPDFHVVAGVPAKKIRSL